MESPLEVKSPSDIAEMQIWSELKPFLTGEQQDPAVGSELLPEMMPESNIGGTQMLPEVKPQSEAGKPKEMFALFGCTVRFNMHFNHQREHLYRATWVLCLAV